jgi:hypothetical protein
MQYEIRLLSALRIMNQEWPKAGGSSKLIANVKGSGESEKRRRGEITKSSKHEEAHS